MKMIHFDLLASPVTNFGLALVSPLCFCIH
jgi:hypothetical protein